MNRGKKLFAILLAAVMILAMGMTGFAANGKPQASDRADVTITGITGNPKVTLYQIAAANYGPGDTELVDYTWAAGVAFADEQEPTADEINAAAKGLTDRTITALETMSGALTGETYTANVPAGVYIAVLTGAADGSVYNPVLLAATYGEEGNLVVDNPEQVNAGDAYLFGTTAVVKKTMPDVDKTITGGTVEDGDKDTVDIGSVVDYKVELTMPSYPASAVNKTLFLTDRLTEGLTFDYSTLTVTIEGQTVVRSGDTFYLNIKPVATAAEKDNGFNLNFIYDNLVSDAATGAVYTPVVTYSAVVNDKAVVGAAGNPNDVTYYYANEPNTGNTWNDVNEEPDEAPGVTSKEDQETVYTYQLAFRKTDAETDRPLAGAVFGIYSDEGCTQLIDKVTTNAGGYAVSTKVAKGTYYIKELVAPTGYSLNTAVYPIEASWTTATTTVTGSVTNAHYTTQKPADDAVQVGWIKDGRYYSMAAVAEEEAAGGYQSAYLADQSTTTSTVTTVTESGAGSGTVLLGEKIPNTQMHALPSTGGMGTMLFTVGGIVIMAAAAVLFFLSRRKTDR